MSDVARLAEEIRARIRLTELIGRSVTLTKRGRNMVGLCPFHEEKSPSFNVSDEKGFYHCFGCGANGSVIDFVMQHQQVDFITALEQLAGLAGLEMPARNPAHAEARQKLPPLRDLLEQACRWFEANLHAPVGAKALAYIRQRAIMDRSLRSFRLGYAPSGGQALINAFKHHDPAQLVEVGLARPTSPERKGGDFFFDRLMFPITDRGGRVIAFAGRLLREGEPKYLNSPETPLFKKNQELFALDQAMDSIRKTGRCIMVEGYMDALALHQAGISETVAICGTAVNDGQLARLWQQAGDIILCLDGDAAGARAALRALDVALGALVPGRRLSFCTLPQGQDPDTFLRQYGGDALRDRIDHATPLAQYLWQDRLGALAANHQPEDRAALRIRLRQDVQRIKHRDLASEYGATLHALWHQQFGNAEYRISQDGRKTHTKQRPWVFSQGYRIGHEDGRNAGRRRSLKTDDAYLSLSDSDRIIFAAGYDAGRDDGRHKLGNRVSERMAIREKRQKSLLRADQQAPAAAALLHLAVCFPELPRNDPENFAAFPMPADHGELRDDILTIVLAHKELDNSTMIEQMYNQGVVSRLDGLCAEAGMTCTQPPREGNLPKNRADGPGDEAQRGSASENGPGDGAQRRSASEDRPADGPWRGSATENGPGGGAQRRSASEDRPADGAWHESAPENGPADGAWHESASENGPADGAWHESASENGPADGRGAKAHRKTGPPMERSTKAHRKTGPPMGRGTKAHRKTGPPMERSAGAHRKTGPPMGRGTKAHRKTGPPMGRGAGAHQRTDQRMNRRACRPARAVLRSYRPSIRSTMPRENGMPFLTITRMLPYILVNDSRSGVSYVSLMFHLSGQRASFPTVAKARNR